MCATYRKADDRDVLRERALASAARHAGVFSPADLDAWGIDPDVVRLMVRHGIWHRLRHGVYTDAAHWAKTVDDPDARHLLECAGALRATKEPAFLFGASAATALGLPWPQQVARKITLVRDRGADPRVLQRRSKNPGALPDVALKTHDLSAYETVVVRGLPCVPLELAAVSAAALVTYEWALAIMDAAAWQQPDMPQRLHLVHRDWPTLRGIGTVRSVLPLVRSGAQTPLESISRYRFEQHGLPEPQLQARFDDHQGLIGFVDMWWPTLGVIGEADGLIKYTDRNMLVAEKLREDRLRRLGYVVVRWTWWEIMNTPHVVVRRILEAARFARRTAG